MDQEKVTAHENLQLFSLLDDMRRLVVYATVGMELCRQLIIFFVVSLYRIRTNLQVHVPFFIKPSLALIGNMCNG